jgi:hypothetical protein
VESLTSGGSGQLVEALLCLVHELAHVGDRQWQIEAGWIIEIWIWHNVQDIERGRTPIRDRNRVL